MRELSKVTRLRILASLAVLGSVGLVTGGRLRAGRAPWCLTGLPRPGSQYGKFAPVQPLPVPPGAALNPLPVWPDHGIISVPAPEGTAPLPGSTREEGNVRQTPASQ